MAKDPKPTAPSEETCTDCGKRIARDEQAYVHKGRILCGPCKGELRRLFDPPASERQKAYADRLGVTYDKDISKIEMSFLLDDAQRRQIEERREALYELSDDENEARTKAREKILSELDGDELPIGRASPSEIASHLTGRGLVAIILTLEEKDIEAALAGKSKFNIDFDRDVLDEEDMRRILGNIGCTMIPGLTQLADRAAAQADRLEEQLKRLTP